MEGSVFPSGDSVRVTVQLVRARPEAHLWAGSHQGHLSDALSLQGEVARAIARAMRARVAPEVEARLVRPRTVDPEAQQLYLRGLHHLERATYAQLLSASDRLREHRRAIGNLEEAVARDPDWAAAHAKLAFAYHWLASGYGGEFEAEYYPKSRAAALRAVALDETESQAHASLGFVLFKYYWDWAGAERAIRRAVELDPNSHHWIYALYLQAAGRHDEAIRHFRMAEERNPLSEMLKLRVMGALACAGRYPEAIAQGNEVRELVESYGETHPGRNLTRMRLQDSRALMLSSMGLHEEAIAAAAEVVALTDSMPRAVASLAFMYARAGRLPEARRLADRFEERARAMGSLRRPALLYAALGDTELAVDLTVAELEGRRGFLPVFRCSLEYELLRDEPRIQELLRPVGFPH